MLPMCQLELHLTVDVSTCFELCNLTDEEKLVRNQRYSCSLYVFNQTIETNENKTDQ